MKHGGVSDPDAWRLYRAVVPFQIWFASTRNFCYAETFLLIVVAQSVVVNQNVWQQDARGIRWAVCGGLTLFAVGLQFALIPAGMRIIDLLPNILMLAVMITSMIWLLSENFSVKRRQIEDGKVLCWPRRPLV